MKVSRYRQDRLPWDSVAGLIGNSFFGSRDFANLWCTLGGKPVYWVAEEGGEIQAVLPGVEFGFKFIRRFHAMPAGCYARLFCRPDIDDKTELAAAIMKALTRAGYIKLFVNDFYATFQPAGMLQTSQRETLLVDISSPDWEPPDKKLRQQIRKAEKEGICRESFDRQRHLSGFLRLVEQTGRRTGSRVTFGSRFFETLAKLAEHDSRLHWVWCEHRGEPVSSNIFIVEGSHLFHWQAFIDEAHSYLQAAKYIPFATARSAAREDITILNLGSSPEDAPGVDSFKRKWGGRPHVYNCYYRKSGLGKLL
ncbi:MAG: GNAT family N-acetyltransferase [bacterium]